MDVTNLCKQLQIIDTNIAYLEGLLIILEIFVSTDNRSRENRYNPQFGAPDIAKSGRNDAT
jgi:hypothetical protein